MHIIFLCPLFLFDKFMAVQKRLEKCGLRSSLHLSAFLATTEVSRP